MILILGAFLTYLFIEILIVLTKKNKYYAKGTTPNVWDYMVTLALLAFFPWGLLIIHSHMRLLLIDHKILND